MVSIFKKKSFVFAEKLTSISKLYVERGRSISEPKKLNDFRIFSTYYFKEWTMWALSGP